MRGIRGSVGEGRRRRGGREGGREGGKKGGKEERRGREEVR